MRGNDDQNACKEQSKLPHSKSNFATEPNQHALSSVDFSRCAST